MNNKLLGHTMAFATIFIWGTTFVSTKVLLDFITPLEILVYRFLIGYFALFLMYPKITKLRSIKENIKEELLFFLLGLTGICLYYLLENIALKYTFASNVGLITATIPLLTSIISHFTTEDEAFELNMFYGGIIAFSGVFLIIFNGKFILNLNPIGDLLAILASVVFAVYSTLLKRVGNKYNSLYSTRKMFFYGLVCMFFYLIFTQQSLVFEKVLVPNVIFNLFFLGLAASALCFVMWNKTVNIIGSIKSSNYIYLVPIITMITAVLIIDETITVLGVLGASLTLLGVYISENGFKLKKINFM